MSNSQQSWGLGVCLAIGLSLSGYFIGQTLYNAKVALNTAEAKGLAERRVKANQATWQIGVTVQGAAGADVAQLYQTAETQQQRVVALLREQGFSDDEVSRGVLNYTHQQFRDDNQQVVDQQHVLYGTVDIDTTQVDLVKQARTEVNQLIAEGIRVDNGQPAYRFTGLNAIKPDMLREATTNARIAANEFADNAGVSVGSIRRARQGSFYIRDAGEDYGDTRKIEKDVRVVTTIDFYLTD